MSNEAAPGVDNGISSTSLAEWAKSRRSPENRKDNRLQPNPGLRWKQIKFKWHILPPPPLPREWRSLPVARTTRICFPVCFHWQTIADFRHQVLKKKGGLKIDLTSKSNKKNDAQSYIQSGCIFSKNSLIVDLNTWTVKNNAIFDTTMQNNCKWSR